MRGSDPRDLVEVPDRAGWRAWLTRHHKQASGAWLVLNKLGSGRGGLTYDEAVEEALCFGWIDSTANRLDERRYVQRFTPRKRGSAWARSNRERVERLETQGLMMPAGRAAVETAKADGSWEALELVDDLTVPEDLRAALAAEPAAEGYFAAFPPSTKKAILFWIASAKRPGTRAKRIAETVTLAAHNRRATEWRPEPGAGDPGP